MTVGGADRSEGISPGKPSGRSVPATGRGGDAGATVCGGLKWHSSARQTLSAVESDEFNVHRETHTTLSRSLPPQATVVSNSALHSSTFAGPASGSMNLQTDARELREHPGHLRPGADGVAQLLEPFVGLGRTWVGGVGRR